MPDITQSSCKKQKRKIKLLFFPVYVFIFLPTVRLKIEREDDEFLGALSGVFADEAVAALMSGWEVGRFLCV
jgi:hypothetical protein